MTWQAETQGEPGFEFGGCWAGAASAMAKPKGRLLDSVSDKRSFCSGLQKVTGQAHLHYGEQMALPVKMLMSSKIFLAETPRIMFDKIPGYLVAQSSCDVKLITTSLLLMN